MSEKISIPPIRLRYQIPTDIGDCYIELLDDRLIFKVDFMANEPISIEDEGLGWEVFMNNFHIVVLKSSVVGIEKSFTRDKKWGVYVSCLGVANDIKTYSKTEAVAQSIFDKIYNWRFENSPNGLPS